MGGRKQWPLEVEGIDTILEEGIDTKDITTQQVLIEILAELKKIEYHLMLATDADLTNANL